MRYFSFIHTILASLLWCAAVFVFVGINFVRYEAASRSLRDSRIESRLSDLQKTFQIEMDKGSSLPELKQAEKLLLEYGQEEIDFSSALIFDTQTGKILFSTLPAQTGQIASDRWRKRCAAPDTVFKEDKENKETVGVSLIDALADNIGCLVAVYSTEPENSVREQMIRTSFRYAFRLAGTGVLVCFLMYAFNIFVLTYLADRKIQAIAALVVFQGILLSSMCMNLTAMFRAFESDLGQEIASKSRMIAGRIAKRLGLAVQSGIPFDSVTALETYMDQIRQKNKEILFVLVTDKTGRVLYESGSASEAFEADPRTGKVSLKEGYFNAAEPVNASQAAIGWVQIGVNERFLREKVF